MFLPRVTPLFRRGFASKAAELAPSFLADLRQILGVERVATGATVCAQHGQDAGPHSGASPQAVVWPETRDQVHNSEKIRWEAKMTKRCLPSANFATMPECHWCRLEAAPAWKEELWPLKVELQW